MLYVYNSSLSSGGAFIQATSFSACPSLIPFLPTIKPHIHNSGSRVLVLVLVVVVVMVGVVMMLVVVAAMLAIVAAHHQLIVLVLYSACCHRTSWHWISG